MKNLSRHSLSFYTQSFIFGVEDSLVSTVGLLSGIAAAGVDRTQILITGVVLIFVEAFSMGVGSYLSEDFTHDYTQSRQSSDSHPIIGAGIMLISYFLAGLIPLSPYLFLSTTNAFLLSITFTLTSLLLLGALSAKYFKSKILKHGLKMLVLGGTAVMIGVAIGKIFNTS